MKTYILPILCCLCCSTFVLSQTSNIRWIELSPEGTTAVEGNLSEGVDMPDLSWAWNSAVACFPATQAAKFTGKHVLYALELPAYTELEIDLIPADKSANFSLYAYEVGTISESNTVPTLSQCIRCEADHKWDYKVKGKTQDHTRHVRDILAIANPYQVIIGVTGADGLKEGAYRLEVKRKG
ncbi:MAG: hypothetical protein IPN60_08665 [Saprospiraceae bacterium]|nr:hypothetical protein [Candidatus Opimibacter skivensis]